MNEFTLSFDDSSKSYTVLSMAELLEELTKLHTCNADKFWECVNVNNATIADFILALYLITLNYGLYTLNLALVRQKGWIGNIQSIKGIQHQSESVQDAYQNLTQFGNTAYPYSVN